MNAVSQSVRLGGLTLLFAGQFILLGILSAFVGGETANNPWYQQLVLPRLQPPGPVFGIAWTILYTLMGAAVARVWISPQSASRTAALQLFALQFVLNLAWNPLFFGARQIVPSIVLLAAIFVASFAATLAAGRVDRWAAWLLVPYLVWLGFAFGLNWRIATLNPGA